MDLNDIHFHDSRLIRVVEMTEPHDLLLEVDYPVDWENNVFQTRIIAFRDVPSYRVDELPFVGSPTLLDAIEHPATDGYRRVEILTNAGSRWVTFKSVELLG